MADFDPFANQGGPAGWDPEHAGDAKKHSEELNRRLANADGEPGAGPSTYSASDTDPDADVESDDLGETRQTDQSD